MEGAGAEFKSKKEEVQRITHICTDTEKLIMRMKANLANTETNILRLERDLEKENIEKTNLKKTNEKLKDDINKNYVIGEKL